MAVSGAGYMARLLEGYGVTSVFLVPTILTRTLAELEGRGVTRVMTHGEKAAAYMADGYSRMTGRPGVCMAQAVGSSNLAAGLKDAWLACTPLVAITGGPLRSHGQRHTYQEIDDFAMYEPLTKANLRVDSLEALPEVMRQAFRVATTGRPGPVHVELAGHYGAPIEDAEADLELLVEEPYRHVPPHRPEPSTEEISALARLLEGAERPLAVAGGGVAASGAEAEVVALARKLSMPVATSLTAKGCLPEDDPLSVGVAGIYSRSCANKAVAEADLVFFIGTGAGGQVTNQWNLIGRTARVVQMDIDPQQLGRHHPVAAGAVCDARAGLARLVAAVEPRSRPRWNERVAALVSEWRQEHGPHIRSGASPMRPERICQEIAATLAGGGTLVCDTGHSAMWAGQVMELARPRQRLVRCEGSLGWGLPATIGAKAAAGPDDFVLGFSGDGGFYYHLAELETAARHGINAAIVVNDNGAMTQEQPLFDAAYEGGDQGEGLKLWTFAKLDLSRVAESLGCLGIRAETPAELRDALDVARAGTDRPLVIDAHADATALAPTGWSAAG
ncbi:MAG: thiamine pyrophosphate-binding protein [Candidatus Dormibacterales bacterium]